MLWAINKRSEALSPLKYAAFLSNSSRDWHNVGIATNEPSLAAYSLEQSFISSETIALDSSLWLFYLKKSIESNQMLHVGHTIYAIVNKIENEMFLRILAKSLILTLYLLKKEQEAEYNIHIVKSNEISKGILQGLARKYFENINGFSQEYKQVRNDILQTLNSDKDYFLYQNPEVVKPVTIIRESNPIYHPQKTTSHYKKTQYSSFTFGENEINDKALGAIRSDNRERAIQLLEEGVIKYPDSTKLWSLLAQQYSATQDAKSAEAAYKKLIPLETRPAAKKNASIQYVQLLAKSGQYDHAEKEALVLIKLYENEDYIKDLLSSIKIMAQGHEVISEWGTNLETDVSQFLRKELRNAEFIDARIVANGGKPTPEDAERLKNEATREDKSSEERYFTSLQAAKAYSLLPIGSYSLDNYHQSLASYAMQRGIAIVNKMLGLAKTSTLAVVNSEILSELADSSTSYFIESLSLLPKEHVQYNGPLIIKNYLYSQIIKHFSLAEQKYDKSLLDGDFNKIFNRMLNTFNPELFTLACESILTWGSYPEVWGRLQRVTGGPSAITSKMAKSSFTQSVKAEFSKLIAKTINDDQPGEILNFCFKHRMEERQSVQKYFRELTSNQATGTFETFRLIKEGLDAFPIKNQALLKADTDMLTKIKLVVDGMMKYREATDDERTDILVRARRGVDGKTGKGVNFAGFETLLEEIKDAPTYWKLVGCEPIIRQSLENIAQMESRRTQSRLPILIFSLEPSTFQVYNSDILKTMLVIKNEGIVSATDVKIFVRARSGENESPFFEEEFSIDRIQSKSTNTQQEIFIPYAKVKEYPLGIPKLYIEAQYAEGQTFSEPFTIDVDKGAHFTVEDIPWTYTGNIDEKIFKGREDILSSLEKQLNQRSGRTFSYMLYGVTRSGKTSILRFLYERIHGRNVLNDEKKRIFLCINLAFNDAATFSDTNAVWKNFLHDKIKIALEDWRAPRELKEDVYSVLPSPEIAQSEHFSPLITKLQAIGIYPVFLVDEFSYYRSLHDKKLLDSASLSRKR